MTALEACPTPSDRADEGPVAPLPGDADRRGRVTAVLVLRWTAVPAGVLDDDVGVVAVLRCTVEAPGVAGDAVVAPDVLRRTAPPPVPGAADSGAAVPDVAVPTVPASAPAVATGDCLTVLPGAATGRPDVSESARRCTFAPDDDASGAPGADAEAPGCGASRFAPEDCGVSGVAEAIGLVPVVAAPVDDEGAVLDGAEASAAPVAAGPAVEGRAPGIAEPVDGGVVARAGVADARCTVVPVPVPVPVPDPGDAVAEVEGDDGAVRGLSVVLPVPAAGLPSREMAGGVRVDDVVAAGLVAARFVAAGLVAAGLVAVGSVGAGVVAAGVVAVRGGAADVRGRRCTAAGPPDGDVADGDVDDVLVVDVVDPPEEVDVLALVDSPDALGVLPVDEPPDVARPPDVLGGVDELAERDVAELLLGVVPGVAGPAGEVRGCCGERSAAAERPGPGVAGVVAPAAVRCTVVLPVTGVEVVVGVPADVVGRCPSAMVPVVDDGAVAGGVVEVRGGAPEVRGRRCTAVGSPERDAAAEVDVVEGPDVDT
ncbi:hypothetical protein ACQPZQ_32985 [Pseudonocardia sp. CA-142604]|uniref:hypothetical protein n=1 Tax=Pseudonocardia sp. CA-142604 TaxID=3240024 RepID=UPI003D8E6791